MPTTSLRRLACRHRVWHWLVVPVLLLLSSCSWNPPPVAGIVWQPDNQTVRPQGNWDLLGAKTLLVQWSVVDDQSFIGGCARPLPELPDWTRIAAQGWASEIILGLAGNFNEQQARNNLPHLLAQSRCIAALPLPFDVSGWYFPVEIDPTWDDAPALAAVLAQLPRPLWVSVYDNSNIGPRALGDWLSRWLPDDVGIFFQDGVGVHARSPEVAALYFASLRQRFGTARVRLIAEAFRPTDKKSFRAATADELWPQLQVYKEHKYQIYLFDGPHYVTGNTVDKLRRHLAAPD